MWTGEWTRAVDEFIHSPVEVVAALVVIAGALSPAFKAGRRFWMNIWARLRSKPIVPTETLRMVQDVHSSFWGMGSVSGEPAMQVVLEGHITDISGNPNRILRAEIPKPLTHAHMVLLSNDHDARRGQILSPHECAEIHVSFFVQPVVGEKGKSWTSPVILVDQYGNRHKFKNCVFRSLVSSKPEPRKDPEEYPYEIADPIEKEVVSVLKAELSRYVMCGRICGGLGSIHMVYQGHPMTGVGGDSWRANSPLNQVIVADPENASLKSDNLEVLVSFYQGLHSDKERARFVKALAGGAETGRGAASLRFSGCGF